MVTSTLWVPYSFVSWVKLFLHWWSKFHHFNSRRITEAAILIHIPFKKNHEELTHNEHIQLRFQELNALKGRRFQAIQNLELYRQNMVRAYGKLVKHRVFMKTKLTLMLINIRPRKPRKSLIQSVKNHMSMSKPMTRGVYHQLVDHHGSGQCLQSTGGSWRNNFNKNVSIFFRKKTKPSWSGWLLLLMRSSPNNFFCIGHQCSKTKKWLLLTLHRTCSVRFGCLRTWSSGK